MSGLREFFNSSTGRGVVIVLAITALGMMVYAFRSSWGTPPDIAAANDRIFIDAQNPTSGKSFRVALKPGMHIPVRAPSGGDTGYPAELCYWTKDGKVRAEPFPVLLNSWVGKPEPTFCPDCGRLVVGHNPAPAGPNAKPPPTKENYKGVPPSERDR